MNINDTVSEFLLLLRLDHKSRNNYLPENMARVRVDFGQLYFETNSPLRMVFSWAQEALPMVTELSAHRKTELSALWAILFTTTEYFSEVALNELAHCEDFQNYGYCGLWIPLRQYAKPLLAELGVTRKRPSKTFNENYIESGIGTVVEG